MSLLGSAGANLLMTTTGDIWSTGAFSFESPLKDLLDSDDEYTLEQLLAEDELLQELRGVHPKLVSYFSTPDVAAKLVEYVALPSSSTTMASASSGGHNTQASVLQNGVKNGAVTTAADDDGKEAETEKKDDDATDDPELLRIRYPYMACEVICCEIPAIVDLLVDGSVVVAVRGSGGDGGEDASEDAAKADAAPQAEPEEDDLGEGGGSPPAVDQIISTEGDNPNVELVSKQRHDEDEDGDDRQTQQQQQQQQSSEAKEEEEQQQHQPQQAGSDGDRVRILDLLFSVLVDTPVGELDDYRAGYFEKILRVLFKKRPDEMTEYVNSGGGYGRTRLIRATLGHLYSHSIMLIAQRLLLPSRPVPTKRQQQQSEKTSGGGGDENDEAAEHGDKNDSDDDDDEEDEEEDHPDEEGEIRSDWASSPEALELLLDCLAGGGIGGEDGGDDDGPLSADEEERRLDLSLHASEVLITIIQNSMLSSQTMLTLTDSNALERLIRAATIPAVNSNGEEYFSPHENLLTTAMSVLESLILQLGGYGAVGTMSLLPADSRPGGIDDNDDDAAAVETIGDDSGDAPPEDSNGDEDPAAASPSPDAGAVTGKSTTAVNTNDAGHLIADLSALLDLLPMLLDNLSRLLQHPSTLEWRTVTQYSKDEPQPMVGSSRLRIVRVLESLVLLGDPNVDARLVQSDCLEVCLNLFWDFQWCSMLHQSVANLLVHVFEGQNARVDMQEYFLIRCNILVRLMDSFDNGQQFGPAAAARMPSEAVVTNLNDVVNEVGGDGDVTTTSSEEKESSGSNNSNGPLPVSDDDVEAAMEKEAAETNSNDDEQVSTEAVRFESRDASLAGGTNGAAAAPPLQSFRFGYMGHVIIICQALVHASRQDYEDEEKEQQQPDEGGAPVDSGESKASSSSEGIFRDDYSKEPLFLAEMVACHPLSDKWNEFVATTLANETSVQSTPLGGYSVSAASGGDPLHAHRPGLADDSDPMGDGPPLPPRGILSGGDTIDMDDNDLDIAASMMASLSMQRPGSDGDDSDEESGGDNSGDSNKSYNSGETNNSGSGYLFDDPLGQVNGGLGIALGQLTKLSPNADNSDEVVKDSSSSDANSSSDESSHSSSSEEEGEQDQRGSDSDVPVMDLFAGNFDYDNSSGGGQQPSDSQDAAAAIAADSDDAPDWSNFANFDNAFAAAEVTETEAASATEDVGENDGGDGDDDFGPFSEAKDPSTPQLEDLFVATPKDPAEVEAIFGGGDHDHSELLEATAAFADSDPFANPNEDKPANDADQPASSNVIEAVTEEAWVAPVAAEDAGTTSDANEGDQAASHGQQDELQTTEADETALTPQHEKDADPVSSSDDADSSGKVSNDWKVADASEKLSASGEQPEGEAPTEAEVIATPVTSTPTATTAEGSYCNNKEAG